MAFMEPQYQEGLWLEVLAKDGSLHYLPADLFSKLPDEQELAIYIEVEPSKPEDPATLYTVVRGVGARLSAPGYLDCTDWFVHPNLEAATKWIEEEYGDDNEEEPRSRVMYDLLKRHMTNDSTLDLPGDADLQLAIEYAEEHDSPEVADFARGLLKARAEVQS